MNQQPPRTKHNHEARNPNLEHTHTHTHQHARLADSKEDLGVTRATHVATVGVNVDAEPGEGATSSTIHVYFRLSVTFVVFSDASCLLPGRAPTPLMSS